MQPSAGRALLLRFLVPKSLTFSTADVMRGGVECAENEVVSFVFVVFVYLNVLCSFKLKTSSSSSISVSGNLQKPNHLVARKAKPY